MVFLLEIFHSLWNIDQLPYVLAWILVWAAVGARISLGIDASLLILWHVDID